MADLWLLTAVVLLWGVVRAGQSALKLGLELSIDLGLLLTLLVLHVYITLVLDRSSTVLLVAAPMIGGFLVWNAFNNRKLREHVAARGQSPFKPEMAPLEEKETGV